MKLNLHWQVNYDSALKLSDFLRFYENAEDKKKNIEIGTCFNIKDFYILSTKRSPVMEILLNEFTWQGQVMSIIKRFVKEQIRQTIRSRGYINVLTE